jgi:uncharacterized protein YbjT (DUF2867 family)
MGPDYRPLVLLTGASGYIGGRLLKELEKAGWPVRCLRSYDRRGASHAHGSNDGHLGQREWCLEDGGFA